MFFGHAIDLRLWPGLGSGPGGPPRWPKI